MGIPGNTSSPRFPRNPPMRQLNITFEPGLSQRSRSVREHLATRVYARGLVETAGKMALSPSKLNEKPAGSDSGGKPRGPTIDEAADTLQQEQRREGKRGAVK